MEITLKPSQKLADLLSDVSAGIDHLDPVPENVKRVKNGESNAALNVSDIRWISQALKKGKYHLRLHELLHDCETVIPSLPKPPPRNPELEARVQRLKAEQDQREYNQMVSNVAATSSPRDVNNIAAEVRQINAQLIEVLGFVVSLGAAFAFGFFGLNYWIGPFEFGTRALLGIFIAITVAIAELYFLVRTLDYDSSKLRQPVTTKLKSS